MYQNVLKILSLLQADEECDIECLFFCTQNADKKRTPKRICVLVLFVCAFGLFAFAFGKKAIVY